MSAYVFPSERSLVGVPFEMVIKDGYLIRKKNGRVHGYNSDVYLVPELKLGTSFMFAFTVIKYRVLPIQSGFSIILLLYKKTVQYYMSNRTYNYLNMAFAFIVL